MVSSLLCCLFWNFAKAKTEKKMRENKWALSLWAEKVETPTTKFSLGEREREKELKRERHAVVWTLNSSVLLSFLYFRVRERKKDKRRKKRELNKVQGTLAERERERNYSGYKASSLFILVLYLLVFGLA